MAAQSGLGFSGIVAIQIPDDGATGEVLTKLSPDNYDYDWAAGGGGGGTIIIEDEGVVVGVPADTLDFVGAGVTASGAGTTKTITIPGGAGDLQAAYDADTSIPQITINATDELTIDASAAGIIFQVRDLADTALLSVADTGSFFYGGTGAGDLLELGGSLAANRGQIVHRGACLIDFDWSTDVGGYALLWNNAVPASGASIPGFLGRGQAVTVNAGTFITSTADDFSTFTWTVAPGFATQTLFFGRPTYQSTSVGIAPSQCFIYAAQAQYRLTGVGAVTVANYRAFSFAPIVRVDNAGDDLSITNTDGLFVGPLYNTRNATAVADFGTIRGVHMGNAGTVLFGLALGSEIAANWIGLDVQALTGLTVSGVRAAVRSAIPVSGTSSYMLLNLSTAPSQFGTGGTHVNDNTPMQFGGATWNAQDASILWATASSALQFFFAANSDSVFLSNPVNGQLLFNVGANEYTFNSTRGVSFGDQTGTLGNQIFNFAAPAFTVTLAGGFSQVLLTQAGSLNIGALGMSEVAAWTINALSFAGGDTGTIADLNTLRIGGMTTSDGGNTVTERAAIYNTGRFQQRGSVQYEPINPAALASGNNNDWAGLLTGSASNNTRHWARIQGNATTSVLTGIDATAVQDGDTFELTNVSANTIDITDQDAASVAANRIITPTGVTYQLAADETVRVRYDSTTARWRLLGGTGA